MKKQIIDSGRLLAVGLIIAWLTAQSGAQNASPVKVRALKDNTNLRAKPALNVEVVGQVAADEELTARSMDAEWVEVVAPTNIDFWVLGDYLKDGAVVCRQTVNVRAGPGINFSVVGQLNNGARVEARGSHADWIKIAPPESCSLWVSRPLVEPVPSTPVAPVRIQPVKQPAIDSAPARSAGTGPAAPAAGSVTQAEARKPEGAASSKPVAVTNESVAGKGGGVQIPQTDKTATIKPPKDLDLIPEIGQGQYKQYEGVLKSKNFLVRSPSDFRLVAEDESGQPRTVCFVKGNRSQLDALIFRRLIIYGRQYWVHRCRQPVIVPEKIILK